MYRSVGGEVPEEVEAEGEGGKIAMRKRKRERERERERERSERDAYLSKWRSAYGTKGRVIKCSWQAGLTKWMPARCGDRAKQKPAEEEYNITFKLTFLKQLSYWQHNSPSTEHTLKVYASNQMLGDNLPAYFIPGSASHALHHHVHTHLHNGATHRGTDWWVSLEPTTGCIRIVRIYLRERCHLLVQQLLGVCKSTTNKWKH